MAPHSSSEAIVINKSVSQELDLKVTLITKNFGKVYAIAKGSNSIRSSRLSALQLGNRIKVSFFQKGDRYWVTEAVTISPFFLRSKSLSQYQLLFLTLEIMNQLLVESESVVLIYPTICQLIDSINHNQYGHFIFHEIKLIKMLGFGIHDNITTAFAQKNLPLTQSLLRKHLESIIEKPLHTTKLFR